jgi:hypothetical protein
MKKNLTFAAFALAIAAAILAGTQTTSAHDWPLPVCPPTCSSH